MSILMTEIVLVRQTKTDASVQEVKIVSLSFRILYMLCYPVSTVIQAETTLRYAVTQLLLDTSG